MTQTGMAAFGGVVGGWRCRLQRGLWAVIVALGTAGPVAAQQAEQAEVQRLVQSVYGLLQKGQDDEAAAVTAQAEQAAAKLGDDSLVMGLVQMTRTALLLKREDFPGAAAAGQRTLAIYDKNLGASHPLTSMVSQTVSMVYTAWGRPALAAPLLERAVAGARGMDSDGSFQITMLSLAADNDLALGRPAAAGQRLAQAWALYEKRPAALPQPGIDIALAQADLGMARGDAAGASGWYQRALDLRLATPAEPRRGMAYFQFDLAKAYRGLGRLAEADTALKQGLAEVGTGTPLNRTPQVPLLREQARLAEASGQPAQAEAALRQALAISVQANGPGNINLPPVQLALADLLRQQGQAAAAEAVYREALVLMEKAYGPAHADMVPAWLGLARLQAAAQQPEAAEASWRRALQVCETVVASDHPKAADALDGLAAVLRATGREPEAAAATERAAAIRRQLR